MTPELPAWSPFDPEAPPQLSANGERTGRVVALVAGAEAMKRGWVGDVALGLAASWGVSTGGRVVAADAAFREPCLHRAAELPLQEGLSDMLLWGSSLQRVARATERVGFVVTAGTPIVDGGSALGSPRWGEVCEGFREAGVTLVVLVPASETGLPDVVREASDVVLLLAPDEGLDPASAGLAAEARAKVRATLGVTSSPGDAAPAALAGLALTPAVPGPILDAPSGAPAGAPAGAPRVEPVEEEPPVKGAFEAALREAIEEEDAPARRPVSDVDDPLYRVSEELPAPPPELPLRGAPARRAARGGGRLVPLTVLVVVLVLAVVVLALMGVVTIPGISRMGDPPEGTEALLPATGAPRQAFSVDVGTYDEAGAADERVSRLAAAMPGLVVFSEPIAEAGLLRQRVLAGPVTDAAAAGALVGRLTAALGDDLGEARAVSTPRAFKLGEMRQLAAARRRVEVLSGLGIPAYVLEVDYDDGTVRYRVYAGAYAEESEGVGLARLLQERGLAASALTERIGRLPGSDS